MIRSIHIENIAVIEKTDITFDDGFNVLTGETGAGKSIVIDSINAVLGERTSRELIRTGADSAVVFAVFDKLDDATVSVIRENGYDVDEDGCLLIQRKISLDGKGNCRINGMPATVGMLKQIGRHLVNIHGQHDSQQLLDEQSHINYLDAAGDDGKLLEQYRRAYTAMRSAETRLKKLVTDEDEKRRTVELLTYQIDELSAAEITVGERERLVERRNLIRNSEQILTSLSGALSILRGADDEPGAASLCRQAVGELQTAARHMDDCEPLYARLNDAAYELEDIADELSRLLGAAEFDPAELDRIEARLDVIYRLSLKYGDSEQAMLDYLEEAGRRLDEIESADELQNKLIKEVNDYRHQAIDAAAALTAVRTSTAEKMAEDICSQLKFLDMPNVRFVVEITPTELSSNGADSVRFLISTNVGEPPKSLSKIASGGELSRIMLAIKSVIAGKDSIGTLIFDEVDTGISGSAAQKVGIKLLETSRGKQVICVTHLAQIAALADNHMKITKSSDGGRTYTHVDTLDRSGREQEVARIMSTGVITDNTLKLAAELIDGRNRF